MMQHLRPAIVLVALFTLVLGIAVPLGFVSLAGAAFPGQAGGSLVERNGKVVGSALLGQSFTADRYFQGRPSATSAPDPADDTKTVPAPYNAANSSGSNLGPTNQALIDRVKEAVASASPAPVPADAVTTSASGLDPDISPENAARQVGRIAAARGVGADRVRELVARNTQGRTFGLLGEPRVNVLALNLALDATLDAPPPR